MLEEGEIRKHIQKLLQVFKKFSNINSTGNKGYHLTYSYPGIKHNPLLNLKFKIEQSLQGNPINP